MNSNSTLSFAASPLDANAALTVDQVSQMIRSISQRATVTSLSVEGNRFDDAGFQLFLDFLRRHNSLRSLNLALCGLGDERALRVVQAVCTQRVVPMTIRELDLSFNGITDAGCRAISQFLRFGGSNAALRMLNLSLNPVSADGLHYLIRANVLSSLEAKHCFPKEGSRSLAAASTATTASTAPTTAASSPPRVSSSGNTGRAATTPAAEAGDDAAASPSSRRSHSSAAHPPPPPPPVTNGGIKSLCAALQDDRRLRSLALDGNHITKPQFAQLLDALATNQKSYLTEFEIHWGKGAENLQVLEESVSQGSGVEWTAELLAEVEKVRGERVVVRGRLRAVEPTAPHVAPKVLRSTSVRESYRCMDVVREDDGPLRSSHAGSIAEGNHEGAAAAVGSVSRSQSRCSSAAIHQNNNNSNASPFPTSRHRRSLHSASPVMAGEEEVTPVSARSGRSTSRYSQATTSRASSTASQGGHRLIPSSFSPPRPTSCAPAPGIGRVAARLEEEDRLREAQSGPEEGTEPHWTPSPETAVPIHQDPRHHHSSAARLTSRSRSTRSASGSVPPSARSSSRGKGAGSPTTPRQNWNDSTVISHPEEDPIAKSREPLPPSKGQRARMLLDRAIVSDEACALVLGQEALPLLQRQTASSSESSSLSVPEVFQGITGLPSELQAFDLCSRERVQGVAKMLWVVLHGPADGRLALEKLVHLSDVPPYVAASRHEAIAHYRSLRHSENNAARKVLATVALSGGGAVVGPRPTPSPSSAAAAASQTGSSVPRSVQPATRSSSQSAANTRSVSQRAHR